MFIDNLPLLSFARLVRLRARNVALRDESRATGMVGLSNGDDFAPDTIVRFDIAAGQDPSRLLDAALNATGARAFWFYGGDDIARRAAIELGLALAPRGAAFTHRMNPLARVTPMALRPPSARDRLTLSELLVEFAPGFLAPDPLFATVGKDVVGVALSETLEGGWSEVRVVVYPAYRGRGYGTAIFSALADRLESAGQLVCAAITTAEGRGRRALEASGFRLSDYYFIATRAGR